MRQDHEHRSQRGNSRQTNFLGNQHAQTDLGQIVTAVARMNTNIEKLEKGQMNRWKR